MSLICAGIFSTIMYVVLAIVILLLMVLIHEFGHYIIGRWLGFKINEFSVGFGKAIIQHKNKRGELISLRIFPLGGYCAFAGEEDEEDVDENKDEKTSDNNEINNEAEVQIDSSNADENKELKVSEKASEIIDEIKEIPNKEIIENKKERDYLLFNEQKPWKRLLVYAAGVTFNFLSAILFSFILLLGFGYDIPKVSQLNPDYAAYYGELQEGDVIWKVNGKQISFAFSGTFSQFLGEQGADKDITLTVKRDNKMVDVVIRLKEEVETKEDGTTANVLVGGFSCSAYQHSFLEALGRSFEVAFGFAWVVLKGFGQIITGQIAFKELGGSISTIAVMSARIQENFVNLFILLPLLASNLAVFNFLPIPALDGGHAVFTLLEWIFRKPVVSRKVENYIHTYGLLFLLGFVIVADIVHLIFSGI